MRSDEPISIWFFIGISLLFNGVLILGAGIYQLFDPPAVPLVLAIFMPESGGALSCW